jgi:O-antigen/teichoic acid export membrane protein
MAALRVNIVTNYAGQLWMAVMGVAFLPLYIRILGMEAFGMVGLMLSFQSIFQLLDFGIGGATNRELSRRAHDPMQADAACDLVRTSETASWLMALAAALLIGACSGLMASHWLRLQAMGRNEARDAVMVIGLTISLQWPSTFYANCLSGLERQPTLNLVNGIFATLRYAGVVPVLLWVSPSIGAFLYWYAIVAAGQSLTMALFVWRDMPLCSRRPRLSLDELRGSRRFAGGLFLTGILALGISQLDRLALVSLRPLRELGYYTLALSVASGLGRLVQPMFNALYPRFSRLVARCDETTLRELYHLSSQYLASVLAAVAVVLIVFSRPVLLLWTGDPQLATKVALPLSMLAAGSALNGLMNIPYALQLAYGWTRLAVTLNAVSLLFGIPYCLFAVSRYGTTGAASIWLLANALVILVGVPLMHKRLLRGEMARWYAQGVLPPMVAAGAVASIGRWLVPTLQRNYVGFALLALVSGMTLLAATLATPPGRQLMFKWARQRHSTLR